MPQPEDIRIEVNEGDLSTKSADLHSELKELDQRLMGNNIYSTITYSSDLISQIDYYSDIAKTILIMRRVFTRTVGSDYIDYVTTMTTTFYNDNGSVDSTITTTLTRSVESKITSCASTFSSSEPSC